MLGVRKDHQGQVCVKLADAVGVWDTVGESRGHAIHSRNACVKGVVGCPQGPLVLGGSVLPTPPPGAGALHLQG